MYILIFKSIFESNFIGRCVFWRCIRSRGYHLDAFRDRDVSENVPTSGDAPRGTFRYPNVLTKHGYACPTDRLES